MTVNYNNVPSAIRFRSHASINRASLSSRHYSTYVCVSNWCAAAPHTYIYITFSWSRTARSTRGKGSTCTRLKSTPRPLLVCRNLLTRRLFALTGEQPFSLRRSTDGKTLGRVIPDRPYCDHPGLSFFVVSQIPLSKPAETAPRRNRSADADRWRRTDAVVVVAMGGGGGDGGGGGAVGHPVSAPSPPGAFFSPLRHRVSLQPLHRMPQSTQTRVHLAPRMNKSWLIH